MQFREGVLHRIRDPVIRTSSPLVVTCISSGWNVPCTPLFDMQHYKDLAGGSGIAGYEIGKNYIRVQFKEGGTYRYTYRSTGSRNVERMKLLATVGVGLTSYINQYVREAYASKEG
jgi:hypothetical protein